MLKVALRDTQWSLMPTNKRRGGKMRAKRPNNNNNNNKLLTPPQASSSSSSSSKQRKRVHRDAQEQPPRVNLVRDTIDTAGQVDMNSAFSMVTAEYDRYRRRQTTKKGTQPRERTVDDERVLRKFLKSRVRAQRACNSASAFSSDTASSCHDATLDAHEQRERNQAERELRAFSVCMEMTDGMNYAIPKHAAPGTDEAHALLELARAHQRKLSVWQTYRPIPTKRSHPKAIEPLHRSLFAGSLYHHAFGTACNLNWFARQLASTEEALMVGRDTFINDEEMTFVAIAFWISRSRYYKLYVVFLVDNECPEPIYYYVDYFYERFCRPLDEHA